ncbi:IPT/TIG domain-containing protein [Paenibacillus sp. DYY-L-2]|uniref:IPT/TIG domain-containing protein n=1 Tax=Paenibacillus sp. DYY-L-2 TaxID=3447013 RepID=UPI003F4F5D51
MKKIITLFTIVSLLFVLFPPIGAKAADNYVTVSKTVSPTSITTEEEALVTLNITGTPPVNVIRPNDVVLIIDRSGSMSDENKMQAAIDSAKGFVDLMDLTKHRVGVVDYSSDTSISSFPLTTDKTAVKNYINGLRAGGSTATGDAIKMARQLLADHRPDAQPVIVLMTDGDATQPSKNPYEYALENAAQAKDEGIVFYTIALLLSNANPNTSGPNLLLKEMATTSHHHHFVLGSVGLADIYAAIVQEIGLASAYDVIVKDIVSPEFEIVPGSYDNNIPKPVVEGNTLRWDFLELKKDVLTFTYKIRHKEGQLTGTFPVSAVDSSIIYKDYTGAQRKLLIPAVNLTVAYPKPTIEKVEPDSGYVQGGETVVITGTNFRPNPIVKFGPTQASNVQYISPTEIRVQAPAGGQGTVDLVVMNDDRQQAGAKYTYFADPVVTAITPSSGPMAGGETVSISGQYFLDGVKVKFGDQFSPKVIFRSANTLNVTVPKALSEGPVDVTVENPDQRSVTVADGYTYIAPLKPTIESLTPNEGQLQGSELIVLKGTNIEPGAKLYFNSTEVSMTLVSSTEAKFRAPAWSVPGKVNVKIVNPSQEEFILADGYTYLEPPKAAPPVISGLTPNSGQMKGNELVTLNGEGFQPGAKLFFNDVDISVTFVSDKQLRFRTPAWAAVESVDVKVVNPDLQEGLLEDGYQYLAPPPPTITTITPKEGLISGGTLVSIKGTGFVSGAKVYFDSKELSASFISENELTVKTPVWTKAELIDVKVVNPDLQEVVITDGFNYTEPPKAPAPTITGVTPNKGLTSGGELVTVNGTNFVAGAKVYLDNTLVTASFVSDTNLRFRTPVWSTAESVDVKVVNPDGEEAVLIDGYAYEAPVVKPPTISSVSPNSSLITGGTLIYINGSDYQAGIKLYLNNTEVPVTLLADNMLRFRSPVWPQAEIVDVKVVNPDLQEAVALQAFTFTEPPKPLGPTITSVTPNTGSASGNNYVYIKGENYQPGVKVWFGNTEVKSVSLLDATQIRVLAPSTNVLGSVDVKVVNPDGQLATLANGYTYQETPITITGISPAKGTTAGGQLVYVYGTNFKSDMTLRINGQVVSFEFLDVSSIRFRTPAASASGTVPVELTSAGGSQAATSFTYEAPPALPAPTIASITPNHGPLAGGGLVYVYGSNFRDGITATWGGAPLAITYLDAGTIRFRVPASSTSGPVELKLTNSDNQSVTTTYTYDAPPVIVPTLTSISPTSGPIGGNNLIYLYGTNFQAGAKVTIGTTTLDATVLDSGTIRFRAPAVTAPASVTVTVTNPDGKVSNSLNYQYQ